MTSSDHHAPRLPQSSSQPGDEPAVASWVDNLVHDHLDAQAQQFDGDKLLAGIKARAKSNALVSSGPSSGGLAGGSWSAGVRQVLIAAAIAAGIAGVAILNFHGPTQAMADQPDQWIRNAQQVLQLEDDRCYQVEANFKHTPFGGHPFLSATRSCYLWTRGESFWFHTEVSYRDKKNNWSWGRDDQGTLWMAYPARKIGVTFDADEVPEPLAVLADLVSLNMETLLNEVLDQFELSFEDKPPHPGSAWRTIVGTPGPDSKMQWLKRIRLDIDPENKVIQQMVLTRGDPRHGYIDITYRLIEERTLDTDQYRVTGHLPSDAEIVGRDDPKRRDPKIRMMFFMLIGRDGMGSMGPMRMVRTSRGGGRMYIRPGSRHSCWPYRGHGDNNTHNINHQRPGPDDHKRPPFGSRPPYGGRRPDWKSSDWKSPGWSDKSRYFREPHAIDSDWVLEMPYDMIGPARSAKSSKPLETTGDVDDTADNAISRDKADGRPSRGGPTSKRGPSDSRRRQGSNFSGRFGR